MSNEPRNAQQPPADEFLAMLKANPDIFQRYPQLLELVSLSDSRGTSSLLEKQVKMLKQRVRDVRSKQHEFVEIARENEQISDSFSDVICGLISYQNLSEFATEFPASLKIAFDIDEVSIKLAAVVDKRPAERASYQAALERLPNKRAVCDSRWPNTIVDLFFSKQIGSAALTPLRTSANSDIIGIIALGSRDPDRYSHGLGTAHLERLGLMAGICYQRLLQN